MRFLRISLVTLLIYIMFHYMLVALFCINSSDIHFQERWPTMLFNFLILIIPLSSLLFLNISNFRYKREFSLYIFILFGVSKLVINLATIIQIVFIYRRIVIGNYYIFIADFVIDMLIIALTVFYLVLRLRELPHHHHNEHEHEESKG